MGIQLNTNPILPPPIAEPVYSNKKESIIVDDPSNTHYPGMSQLVYGPSSFYYSFLEVQAATNKLDSEGKLDAFLQMVRTPTAFAYAIAYTATIVFKVVKYAPIDKFFLFTPVLGILASSAEGLSELLTLKRVIQFNRNFHENDHIKYSALFSKNSLEILESHYLKGDLEYLQRRFFTLQPSDIVGIKNYVSKTYASLEPDQREEKVQIISNQLLQNKRGDLARRVRPWLAEKIELELPEILADYNSSDPKVRAECLTKAKNLKKAIDLQTFKRIVVHIVGLAAIALFIVGFSLMIVSGIGAPAVIALLSIAGIVAFIRFFGSAGYLDSPDWSFKYWNLFPLIVQEKGKKLFHREKKLILHRV